jgi:hypothetical protein
MNRSRVLRVWMLVTGFGALVAFALFSIYRGFLPGGDMGTFYVAPGAYALLVVLALATVGLAIAWVVLLVVWLVRRRVPGRR